MTLESRTSSPTVISHGTNTEQLQVKKVSKFGTLCTIKVKRCLIYSNYISDKSEKENGPYTANL